MNSRVYFSYVFVLRFLIAYCVKNYFFARQRRQRPKTSINGCVRSNRPAHAEQPFEIDEFPFDVLHRFTAGTDQVVMRFEIAVHPHRVA